VYKALHQWHFGLSPIPSLYSLQPCTPLWFQKPTHPDPCYWPSGTPGLGTCKSGKTPMPGFDRPVSFSGRAHRLRHLCGSHSAVFTQGSGSIRSFETAHPIPAVAAQGPRQPLAAALSRSCRGVGPPF